MVCAPPGHFACNTVLLRHHADPPRPLDFLVNGQLLRQSLQQLMLDSNISAVRFCRDTEPYARTARNWPLARSKYRMKCLDKASQRSNLPLYIRVCD